MIELSKTIQTSDGVLVPAGVRLDFRNGKAKYQGHPIERKFVPLQAIKGAQGPFLNACVATVLNDNRGFQQIYNKKYQDWAHCVVSGDYLFIYVWDTREVIEVIPGLHAAAKGGPIIRRLINPKTGEVINQVLGHAQFGWTKLLYEMLMWPQYHRQDNGLPLVTKNPGWQEVIDNFNQAIETKFAYEAAYLFDAREADEFTPEYRNELAEQGLAMPDGSYPIRNLDDLHNAIQAYGRTGDNKEETKNWIIKRAKELNAVAELPESWNMAVEAVIGPRGREIQVFRYNASMQSMLKQFKVQLVDNQPWMHIAIAKAKPCYVIYIWDTRQVLASGDLSKEDAMKLVQLGYQMKAFANDNAQPLKGSGEAVKVMNWSMSKAATEAKKSVELDDNGKPKPPTKRNTKQGRVMFTIHGNDRNDIVRYDGENCYKDVIGKFNDLVVAKAKELKIDVHVQKSATDCGYSVKKSQADKFEHDILASCLHVKLTKQDCIDCNLCHDDNGNSNITYSMVLKYNEQS